MRVLALLLLAANGFGACLPITEAPRKLGSTLCLTGKVLSVERSPSGSAWFLNFCQDYTKCPFSAVVFTKDLRDVGDVRMLAGRTIEVHGKVLQYKGVPEIIIRDARQLKGESARLPPIPKDFDVQKKGRFRAGQGSIKPEHSSSSTDAEKR
jgi:DNA/RNA endonuclease YhcR with UshA esterase domain